MSLDWTTLTDGEPATLSIAGREAAFAEIMRRHRQSIFRMVRACVGEADELLDPTARRPWSRRIQALPRYDGDRSMRAWLSTIAINKCRDWGRKRTVRRFLAFAATDRRGSRSHCRRPGGDRRRDGRPTGTRPPDARRLAGLPTALKESLVLRTIEGLSQAENRGSVVDQRKAVETRLYRARSKLLERLGGR